MFDSKSSCSPLTSSILANPRVSMYSERFHACCNGPDGQSANMLCHRMVTKTRSSWSQALARRLSDQLGGAAADVCDIVVDYARQVRNAYVLPTGFTPLLVSNGVCLGRLGEGCGAYALYDTSTAELEHVRELWPLCGLVAEWWRGSVVCIGNRVGSAHDGPDRRLECWTLRAGGRAFEHLWTSASVGLGCSLVSRRSIHALGPRLSDKHRDDVVLVHGPRLDRPPLRIPRTENFVLLVLNLSTGELVQDLPLSEGRFPWIARVSPDLVAYDTDGSLWLALSVERQRCVALCSWSPCAAVDREHCLSKKWCRWAGSSAHGHFLATDVEGAAGFACLVDSETAAAGWADSGSLSTVDFVSAEAVYGIDEVTGCAYHWDGGLLRIWI